jgi:hypothetical protein
MAKKKDTTQIPEGFQEHYDEIAIPLRHAQAIVSLISTAPDIDDDIQEAADAAGKHLLEASDALDALHASVGGNQDR